VGKHRVSQGGLEKAASANRRLAVVPTWRWLCSSHALAQQAVRKRLLLTVHDFQLLLYARSVITQRLLMAEAGEEVDAHERRRDKLGQYLYVESALSHPATSTPPLSINRPFPPSDPDPVAGKRVTIKANWRSNTRSASARDKT